MVSSPPTRSGRRCSRTERASSISSSPPGNRRRSVTGCSFSRGPPHRSKSSRTTGTSRGERGCPGRQNPPGGRRRGGGSGAHRRGRTDGRGRARRTRRGRPHRSQTRAAPPRPRADGRQIRLPHRRRDCADRLRRHPNAGGVLVLGLGCENNQMDALLELAGNVDRDRLRFFNSQDVTDEVDAGLEALGQLVAAMTGDRREECPASDLILGHKCGGSDGLSGITANPLVGRIADRVTALGGGVILTEVPEMFGAERLLMNRAVDETVFQQIVTLINDFKAYFIRHGQPIYENPSPGNVAGGLTTLEEKSLGAIQKGGQATVTQVLRYGAPAATGAGGLALLESPGNDGVSSTALVASGATVLLFTTGRGTPLGFPVPTLKISSNTAIAEKKPHWIDLNAGAFLDGTATMDQLADDLFALILDVASGRALANNEKHGYREIAIWKEGVTL